MVMGVNFILVVLGCWVLGVQVAQLIFDDELMITLNIGTLGPYLYTNSHRANGVILSNLFTSNAPFVSVLSFFHIAEHTLTRSERQNRLNIWGTPGEHAMRGIFMSISRDRVFPSLEIGR
jgi:hypothetical protein